MKRGKRYTEAAKLVDRSVQYDAADAIAIVKKAAAAKFDETVEVHIRTGCDGRHADQQIRGAVVLPHGTGYITDAGMTGPIESVLGVKPELVIKKQLSKMPVRFDFADGDCKMDGVLFDIDEKTGLCRSAERLSIR